MYTNNYIKNTGIVEVNIKLKSHFFFLSWVHRGQNLRNLQEYGRKCQGTEWKNIFGKCKSCFREKGSYHFPFGFVARSTQAKWNHSIGHWKEREWVVRWILGALNNFSPKCCFHCGSSCCCKHLHRGYHIQSSLHMTLDDTDNMSAHWDRLACLRRQMAALAGEHRSSPSWKHNSIN